MTRTTRRVRATTPVSDVPPVTTELRERAHRLLDRTLDDHPGTTGIVIVVAKGKDVDAASEPDNMAQKLGAIDQCFYMLHPEKVAE